MNGHDLADTLDRIYRHARDRDIDELSPWIAATMECYAIDQSPLEMAHFLAQIGHESGELRYREEIASGRAYEWRRDLGNTRPGDGRKFKGRGLIQCTGRYNYTAYDEHLDTGGLLLRQPELVAEKPELCCDVAGWYWSRHNLGRHARADDLVKVTRLINGGRNGLRDRQRLLHLAKAVLIPRDKEGVARSTAELQMALNSLGEDLAVDGVMGPKTRAAVKSFQALHGLTPDGIAGPKTWAVIEALLSD